MNPDERMAVAIALVCIGLACVAVWWDAKRTEDDDE